MQRSTPAQFDVALDCPHHDELEIIGIAGKIVVPDPWLCSGTTVTLPSPTSSTEDRRRS